MGSSLENQGGLSNSWVAWRFFICVALPRFKPPSHLAFSSLLNDSVLPLLQPALQASVKVIVLHLILPLPSVEPFKGSSFFLGWSPNSVIRFKGPSWSGLSLPHGPLLLAPHLAPTTSLPPIILNVLQFLAGLTLPASRPLPLRSPQPNSCSPIAFHLARASFSDIIYLTLDFTSSEMPFLIFARWWQGLSKGSLSAPPPTSPLPRLPQSLQNHNDHRNAAQWPICLLQ